MIKRLTVAVAALFVLFSPAFGAGTIPFSLSQQLDQYAKPLAGCKFYTIQAGTTSTPQNAYQDSALTLALPNPQTCDAAGRLPQMFLADGTVKIRLTDKNGVTQVVADNILVVGASSGGGGGGTVDPTTIMATGDVKARYGTGVLTGFVRANGRTIGSATSGATERANADTQALFEYLWQTDANLTVSTGRGASANADWVANKTIALPDGRNRGIAALGDMGNSDAALFTGSTFANGNSTTLGSRLGVGTPRSLLQSNLPNITPTFTGIQGVATSQQVNIPANSSNISVSNAGGPLSAITASNIVTNITSVFTPQGSISSINGNVTQTSFDTVSPFILVTIYMKL